MLTSVNDGNKLERELLSLPQRDHAGGYPELDKWGETSQRHPYCNQTSFV
jgi:hypothetical protein